MFNINKISSDSVIDYAAEELRKYLRMMMPECGNIEIKYNPDAKDGFRLGLMQDLGLDVSDVKDTKFDDILYIKCDTDGGIIAGDNPRSVLLSVYEYLRQNGCRWLIPGVDGEFIPMQNIAPVTFRHAPSIRYRAFATEGFIEQSSAIDMIEFMPKVGMNTFMIEFFTPVVYYRRYYYHAHNEMNRNPEPVSDKQVRQWKMQCEAELMRRGMIYHDVGHGWTMQPFGINTELGKYTADTNDATVTPWQRQFVAMINGERKLFEGYPNHTQFCMSNPEARDIVAHYVAEYAKNHPSDYLHVWLGDGWGNHCECEECKKMIPSEYYVMLLNRIDEVLAEEGLDTRIVFIAYTETMWAPEIEKIKNQDRFALMFAPSSRKYSVPFAISDPNPKIPEFVRNKNVRPTTNELFRHYNNWRKNWSGANIVFEYHFWRHIIYDVGGTSLAGILNEDMRFYLANDISGIIQDGSMRAFFPTGLAFYSYARSSFDTSISYDEIKEDYFSTAFGEDWKEFYNYLEKLGNAFSHEYLAGEKNKAVAGCEWYDPSMLDSLKTVPQIVKEGRALIESHYNSDYRVRTVSVRLLEFHARYAELFAEVLSRKCVGDDAGAMEAYYAMMAECGKREAEFERWYDHGLFFEFIGRRLKRKSPMSAAEVDAV